MINDILQIASVVVILILAVWWIVRRLRRPADDSCHSGCCDCPISDKCGQRKK